MPLRSALVCEPSSDTPHFAPLLPSGSSWPTAASFKPAPAVSRKRIHCRPSSPKPPYRSPSTSVRHVPSVFDSRLELTQSYHCISMYTTHNGFHSVITV